MDYYAVESFNRTKADVESLLNQHCQTLGPDIYDGFCRDVQEATTKAFESEENLHNADIRLKSLKERIERRILICQVAEQCHEQYKQFQALLGYAIWLNDAEMRRFTLFWQQNLEFGRGNTLKNNEAALNKLGRAIEEINTLRVQRGY